MKYLYVCIIGVARRAIVLRGVPLRCASACHQVELSKFNLELSKFNFLGTAARMGKMAGSFHTSKICSRSNYPNSCGATAGDGERAHGADLACR